MKHKGVSLIEVLIVVVILGILGYLVYGVYGTREKWKDNNAKMKAYAEAHAGIEFNAVSGWNEKSGNAFAIALENPKEKSWETFLPCTTEQMQIKITDKVRFKALDKPLPFANIYLSEDYRKMAMKNCYLKMVVAPKTLQELNS